MARHLEFSLTYEIGEVARSAGGVGFNPAVTCSIWKVEWNQPAKKAILRLWALHSGIESTPWPNQ